MPLINKDEGAVAAAYVRLVFAQWRTVLIFCLLGLLGSIIYLHTTPKAYTATMTVVATQPQSSSSTIGQLAAVVGIATPQSQPITPFTLYPDVLTSRIVADKLARDHPDTLRRIFSWDEKTQSWHRPGRLHAITDFIKPFLGIPVIPWQAPNGEQLREVLQGRVAMAIDSRRPVITLSFDSADPNFAKEFLEEVTNTTDAVIKQMTLDRSSSYAKYLESKLATVQAYDLRQVLITSYSQQVTQVMLSSSAAAFAAQPIGGASVSTGPTRPKAVQALVAGLVMGLGAGIVDAILKWRLLQLFLNILGDPLPKNLWRRPKRYPT